MMILLQKRSALTDVGVNVFGRPSKRDSLLIELNDVPVAAIAEEAEPLPSSAEELVAAGLLGSRRWCNFPFLVEAQVVGVCDGSKHYKQRDGPKVILDRSSPEILRLFCD